MAGARHVPIDVEEPSGGCVYPALLMPALEPTHFWVAAFVLRHGCHVVLSSVLSVIGRCFELMWQLWKPAALFSPVLRLCSLLGGSWMPAFPYCAGVTSFWVMGARDIGGAKAGRRAGDMVQSIEKVGLRAL